MTMAVLLAVVALGVFASRLLKAVLVLAVPVAIATWGRRGELRRPGDLSGD